MPRPAKTLGTRAERTRRRAGGGSRERPPARKLLLGVFGCSPHLANLAARDPARLARLLLVAPEAVVARLVDEARVLESADDSRADASFASRQAGGGAGHRARRSHEGLGHDDRGAGADANRRRDAARRRRIHAARASIAGKLELFDHRAPERVSARIFLGMGKQGAYELNYSCDIDLVVLFDRQPRRARRRHEDVDLFSRLTRRVVKIMSERTADGYVFAPICDCAPIPARRRSPFRWRRPIPITKACPELGARRLHQGAARRRRYRAGEIFLKELRLSLWRKYFDFAAIADVHSIKRADSRA